MKKIIFICFFACMAGTLSAQDLVSSFLKKHSESEEFQVMTIGKKMLELLVSIAQKEDAEIAESLEGLDNIRVVSSSDTIKYNGYYTTAYNLINKSKEFEILMSSQTPDNNTVLAVKESKGLIKELVLISGDEQSGTFNLVSLTGKINLDTLAKYAGKLRIKGLDQLNKWRENE